MYRYLLLESRFGIFGIVWQQAAGALRVCHIFLPRAEAAARNLILRAYPDAVSGSAQPVAQLADQIARFLEGQDVHFDIDILALERCSDFQTRVLLAEYQIPRGWVSSYGRIARQLGVPGGARAVGGALARNPFPIIIPCHRAIRSDGRLGGFQGGVAMKRALLELEDVEVSAAGRVLTERLYY